MGWKFLAKAWYDVASTILRQPLQSRQLIQNLAPTARGLNFSRQWTSGAQDNGAVATRGEATAIQRNPLWDYFESHCKGRGIWKWEHYFDIYHRHFNKFVGREVYVLEIGIYSGGSLDMWKDYFGPKCRVIGVDIEEACKAYEDERTQIFIGDQADREFWRRVRKEAPIIDVVIDDGGHLPKQQIVTLEELLPHLRPGGVYLCEDVLDPFNRYSAYVHGIADDLNSANYVQTDASDQSKPILVKTNELQRDVYSIHRYPFVTVFEKNDNPIEMLVSRKRGSEWQPFL